MTPKQKEIARHMLGLPNKPSKRSYRNRFCAGEGHDDYPTLLAMQENGYVKCVHAKRFHTVDDMWFLTLRGAVLALEKGESLDMEDFPEVLR